MTETEFRDQNSVMPTTDDDGRRSEGKAYDQHFGFTLPLPGSWLPISRAAQSSQKSARHDFLAFLGVAQRINVDFFPITWHPGLDNIGEGATAEIREVLIDVQMSYAFKRFLLSGEDEESAFRNLIAEISILGLECINDHPNIIKLEGIGWDIPSDGKIMPVLVFEKTSHGDLETFLPSESGKMLDFKDKLKLCINVGHALIALSEHNIIHGDLGSRNVLVFETTPGNFLTKISDFGFSSVVGDQDVVYLPRTKPWYAPEWRRTAFSHAEAVKADIFSYGLLSLWILFSHSESFPSLEELDVMKEDNRLLSLADQLVTNATGLNSEEMTNLVSFFHVTLSQDPELRSDEFSTLVHLLSKNSDNPRSDLSSKSRTAPDSINEEFSVLPRIMQFYFGDIRVRRYIAERLEIAATTASKSGLYSGPASHNILFQLAFCYEIGFGVRRNQEKATIYLEQSKTARAVLDDHVKVIQAVNYRNAWFTNLKFREAQGAGVTLDIDYDRHYGKPEQLNALVEDLREEIGDVEAVVGPESPIVVLLKSRLSQILNAHGSYKQSEGLSREILQIYVEHLGEDDGETLHAKGNLAMLLWNQGHLKEAEKVEREVVDKLKGIEEADNPMLLSRMVNLASTLRETGQWDEAESLLVYVLEKRQSSLGMKHPTLLTSKMELALLYHTKGQYKDAERLETEILESRTELFGPDHPDTLNSMTNLGLTVLSLGRWDEAYGLLSSVAAKSTEVLGENHPDTMSTMTHLAAVLEENGRWPEGEEIHRKALTRSLEVLGLEHPDTLSQMHSLAICCRKQSKLEEAESLIKTVIQEQEKTLGSDSMKTVSSIAVLSHIYLTQGRISEAESLATQVMERRRSVFGLRNPRTLQIMSHLGEIFVEKGDYERAEELLLEVVRNSDLLGVEHPETLANLTTLADLQHHQGYLRSAEDLYCKLLEIYNRIQGEEHPDAQAVAGNLALLYKSQKRHEEARTLEAKLLDTSVQTLGEKHRDTQVTMLNLALTLGELGEWQQASAMSSKAMELMIETLGSRNEDTLVCMHVTAQLLTRSGRLDEAEKVCIRVVKLRAEVLGEEHPDTVESAVELNEIWRRKGDDRCVGTSTTDFDAK